VFCPHFLHRSACSCFPLGDFYCLILLQSVFFSAQTFPPVFSFFFRTIFRPSPRRFAAAAAAAAAALFFLFTPHLPFPVREREKK
jgi:hypothetical protein